VRLLKRRRRGAESERASAERVTSPQPDLLLAATATAKALTGEVQHPRLRSLPFAAGSWLQIPTLADRRGDLLLVAGSGFYRAAVLGAIESFGALATADLRIQEAGEYAGAVRVYVDDQDVGAVPTGFGDPYRDVIRQLIDESLPCTCHVRLETEPEGDKVWVRVKLCGLPTRRQEDAPFLPSIGDPAEVWLSDDGRSHINRTNPRPSAKKPRVATLDHVTGSRWLVRVDGQEVGELRLRTRGGWLREADKAGLPLTAHLFRSTITMPGRVFVEIPSNARMRHIY
jgi:hypothetical protein